MTFSRLHIIRQDDRDLKRDLNRDLNRDAKCRIANEWQMRGGQSLRR